MIESYSYLIIAAIITFIVSFALKYVGPKSRIVWWKPHYFVFNIRLPDQPNIVLVTETITIQNIGSKRSKDIEIAHKTKPDFFKLMPALDYTITTAPDGEHILKIPFLAPGEFFNIEFMTYTAISELLYIRSEWGIAKNIPTQHQRVLPKWILVIIQGLLLIGIFTASYWLVKAFLYVSAQIG